jgi:uncharacterized membrane protein
MGLVFVILGRIMPQVEPNPWMGIRTASTLGDPDVWRLTHERAGPRWVWAGLGTAIALWLLPGSWGLAVGIVLITGVSILDVLYARKLAREKKKLSSPQGS